MRGIIPIVSLVALLVCCGRASAGQTTFTDHTFANSDWSATTLTDTTAGQVATFSAQQSPTGGNPDQFRTTQHNIPSLGDFGVAQFSNGSSYNPSASGAINSVDYSYDLIHLNPPQGQAVAYAPLIEQAGVRYTYTAAIDLTFTQDWNSFPHNGLVATDFLDVNSGVTSPDFSASASPILFGFASKNTNSGGNPLTRLSGIDNWSVTIHTQDPTGPTPIPLPPGVWGGLLLLAAGAVRIGRIELKRLM